MSRGTVTLVDERAALSLRDRIGALMAGADAADFAVARIRLAVLDLSDGEMTRVRRCRVLLGHLDASTLLDAAGGDAPSPEVTAAMARLLRFVHSGRLEVRSAGLLAWTPDFALFHQPGGTVGLAGAIYFASPQLVAGPCFTLVTDDPDATRMLAGRFEQAWARAHDVLPAIREVLEQAHAMVGPAGAGGGGPHPR